MLKPRLFLSIITLVSVHNFSFVSLPPPFSLLLPLHKNLVASALYTSHSPFLDPHRAIHGGWVSLRATFAVQSNHCSKIPYNEGAAWPDLVVGIIATILLAGGLLPPYFELWKRNGRVVGLSKLKVFYDAYISNADTNEDWVFLSIDTLGGLFSLFALGTPCFPLTSKNQLLNLVNSQRRKERSTSLVASCIFSC